MYATESVHTTYTSRTRSRTAGHAVTPTEFFIIGLAIVFLLLAAASGRSTHAITGIETSTVRVQPNQSLWSIALEHPVDGLTTAQAVELIRQVNAMDTSRLRAGQLLEVPVSQEGSAWVAAR
jgi:hypothetical protein